MEKVGQCRVKKKERMDYKTAKKVITKPQKKFYVLLGFGNVRVVLASP
jgi:hypothetical protein